MRRVIPAVVLSCLALGSARADNWPQWRGPTGDGVSRETDLPVKWDENDNLAWKLTLPGRAGSTPVVWGGRILLTTECKRGYSLLCVSTGGRVLWETPVAGFTRREISGPASGEGANEASPSPCTDGKHVWAFFGTGDLVCTTLAGKIVWEANLQRLYGHFEIQFGMHSTPVLHGDRLYFQLLHSDANVVVALDKATGKEVWKVDRVSDGRGECPHSYASPVIWNDGTTTCLVTHGNDCTIGHDLNTGAELWRLTGLNGPAGSSKYDDRLRFVASPVATPDLLVVPTGRNKGVVGLKPGAKGTIKPGDPVEQFRLAKGTPDVPSPLVHDGLVYLVSETGKVTCVDTKTGEQKYSQPLFRPGTEHRASPVLGDGKLYVLSRDDGVMHVLKAGPTFALLAANKLDDKFLASPAISNGRIYLRGHTTLYAIGK